MVLPHLFLIRRDFGQDRRLQPLFLLDVERKPAGRDEARGHENDQIAFDVLIDIGAEQLAEKWNLTV